MRKFVTREIESIKAAERVEELCIDGIGQIEAFEQALIGTTYAAELSTILKYVEHVANGNRLPDKKLVIIKGGNGETEYEFKSKHLRLYAIQLRNNKLVVFIGRKRKADSSDNIKAFRLLTQQYIEYQKNNQ